MKRIFTAIKTALRWIGYDGALHFALSALLVVGFSAFAPVWSGVAVAVALGLGKEIYDLCKVGAKGYDWKHSAHDIACDAAGLLVGFVCVMLFIYVKR